MFVDDRSLAIGCLIGAVGAAGAAVSTADLWVLLAPLAVTLGYAAAALGLNRTEIRVDERTVAVRVVPLPWLRRSRTFARDEVRELVFRSTRPVRDGTQPPRAAPGLYGVDLVTRSGAHVAILDSTTVGGALEVVRRVNATLARRA